MKVALVGNMNNNNFALMRYLRDLGVDAHLLCFDNELDHFGPEHDTWHLAKWQRFIHALPFGDNPRHLLLKSGALIRNALREYPFTIGSGLTPALFRKAGLELSIFFPYSAGIEWVGLLPSDGRPFSPTHLFHRWVRRCQMAGLRRHTRFCTSLDLSGTTEECFHRLGVPFQPLGIPMVYNREQPAPADIPAEIRQAKAQMAGRDLVIFSQARHYWRPRAADPWSMRPGFLKRNDLLFRAFAEYLPGARRKNPLLVLLKYGPDVEASQELVTELGIQSRVLWLPRMSRKHLVYLLAGADFVVGEFTGEGIWGGTAWEGLAAGRPVFQAVNYKPEDYRRKAGHELPPLIHVAQVSDIVNHLRRFETVPEEYTEIGRQGAVWFNRHQGIELVRDYVRLLERIQCAGRDAGRG